MRTTNSARKIAVMTFSDSWTVSVLNRPYGLSSTRLSVMYTSARAAMNNVHGTS